MATLIDKYFSKPDFDAIEAAVAKAESTTHGEIAIELSARSRNWPAENLFYSLAVGLLAAVATLFVTWENNWGIYYDLTQVSLWGGIGFLAAWFVLVRVLKRRSRRRRIVWLRAVDRFGQLESVRGEAGVLIFASLDENEVAVVADKGIASKVSPDFWVSVYDSLVESVTKGQHAEGLIEAIERVGGVLTEHFPRVDDDINELPDKPTIVD